MRERIKKALGLYWYFFRIGWFTFGGGWSIVAQIQTDFAEKRNVIDSQELLDIVSVGRSLPGIMIGNVSYLFGYHMCGAVGGVLAVLGVVTPPLIILSALTFIYQTFRANVYVAGALTGVRAVVAPIILSAVLRLQKVPEGFPKAAFYGLCAAGCVLSLAVRMSTVLIVAGAVGVGLGYYLWQRRRPS